MHTKIAENQDELRLQTERLLTSELGQYLLDELNNLTEAYTSNARNVANSESLRYLDKSTGVKEAINLIVAPTLN